MNKIRFISVLLVLVNSGFSFAARREDYDVKKVEEAKAAAALTGEVKALRDPKPYLWLYQILMPTEFKKTQPDRTLKSFKVHLQDTYAAFPHPDEIRGELLWQPQNKLQNTYRTLTGKITYVGFFQKTYKYDVITLTSGSKIMRVKLHFKNATAADLAQLTDKLKKAEDFWNASRWPRDFAYSFKFQIVEAAKDAHYSIQLKDKTRGPYDTYWSRAWGARSIAHEMGHMFGLGDEYETLTGRSDCLEVSLMCGSGGQMLHNYYFILRRLVAVK
ncbi:MAG: hypothetical protein AABZ31_02495 [Bdellovibrionota bacterium]